MHIFVPCVSAVVSMLVFAILCSPIGAKFIERLKSREIALNEEAKANKIVALDKRIAVWFRVGAVMFLVFCIAAAIPYYRLSGRPYDDFEVAFYVILNVIVWAFSIAMWIMIYLQTKKIVYDDNGFIVVNCFGFEKRYSYGDIVEISGENNKKIKLKKGSVLLFNAMSGLQSFLFQINTVTKNKNLFKNE